MQDKEFYNEIIKEISRLKKNNTAIIVEGKNDRIALENFGMKNIYTLNKKPIYCVVEQITENERKCAILTDLDAEGKKLYGKLNKQLSSFGIKIENRLRELLFRTKLRQIEGIDSYFDLFKRSSVSYKSNSGSCHETIN